MRCQFCHSKNTKTVSVDHRQKGTSRYIRCLDCSSKFATIERYVKYRRGPKRGSSNADTKGSNNGNSVLTEQNIIDIRKLKTKGMTNRAISAIYGIDSGHVSRIVNHKVWTHV